MEEKEQVERRQRIGAWLRSVRLAGGPEWRDMARFSAKVGRSARQIQGMERGERVGRETYAVVCEELKIDYERIALALDGGPYPDEDEVKPSNWPKSRPFLQPWEPSAITIGGGVDAAGMYMSAVSAIRTEQGVISHLELRFYPGDPDMGIAVNNSVDVAYNAHRAALDAVEPKKDIYARERRIHDAGTAEAQKRSRVARLTRDSADT